MVNIIFGNQGCCKWQETTGTVGADFGRRPHCPAYPSVNALSVGVIKRPRRPFGNRENPL